jgi:TPP-dependent pyruvate/acetoin dehydrogenase alpha subunit
LGIHRLNEKDLPTTATTTKEEMISMFTSMVNMRRMEIVSD